MVETTKLPGLGGLQPPQAALDAADTLHRDIVADDLERDIIRLGKRMSDLEDLIAEVKRLGGMVSHIDGIVGQIAPGGVLEERNKTQQAVIDQLAAQLRQQESACLEYRDAILQMRQQLDVLARSQMHNNHRVLAMQLSIQAKGPADDAKKLVSNAGVFYEFLNQQPPAVTVAIEPPHTGNSVDNDPPTTH